MSILFNLLKLLAENLQLRPEGTELRFWLNYFSVPLLYMYGTCLAQEPGTLVGHQTYK